MPDDDEIAILRAKIDELEAGCLMANDAAFQVAGILSRIIVDARPRSGVETAMSCSPARSSAAPGRQARRITTPHCSRLAGRSG